MSTAAEACNTDMMIEVTVNLISALPCITFRLDKCVVLRMCITITHIVVVVQCNLCLFTITTELSKYYVQYMMNSTCVACLIF